MPGTAHAFAGYETLGQRAVIMRAMGADGEDFAAALHQQHLFVADMAEELAVDEIRERDTLGEVRTLRFILVLIRALGHRCAPTRSPRSLDAPAGQRFPKIDTRQCALTAS